MSDFICNFAGSMCVEPAFRIYKGYSTLNVRKKGNILYGQIIIDDFGWLGDRRQQ